MDINFLCSQCNKGFIVENTYLSNKTKIVCPNCNNEFSDEATQLLKEGFKKLTEARAKHCKVNFSFNYPFNIE